MPETTKAQRGDLVALLTEHSYARQGAPSVKSVQVELALVTGITREGAIREVQTWCSKVELGRLHGLLERRLVPKAAVDVTRCLDAYRTSRPWPSGNGTAPMPFTTMDEAKEFIRPFLRAA